jgi:hypothetical protein
MAIADYRTCDICCKKAFYDADLNYKFIDHKHTDEEETLQNSKQSDYLLGNCWNWVVLCRECSKKYTIKIEAKL